MRTWVHLWPHALVKGSGVTVAMAWTDSYSSNLTPTWKLPCAVGADLKQTNKQTKRTKVGGGYLGCGHLESYYEEMAFKQNRTETESETCKDLDTRIHCR